MSVLLPSSLREARALLADHPGAIPLAGGTDLMVHWPLRPEAHAETYLDLSKVPELRTHRWTDDALVLGGTTTYWDVIRDRRVAGEFPLLVDAARQVGAIQVQSRGTWAGNIVNASPAADGVPVLMAYDAVVRLVPADGADEAGGDAEEEEVPLSDFYLGYKRMRRRPDQLVTSIRIPLRPHRFQVFEKVGSRSAQAIAKVGLAVAVSDAGWRVVAASLAPTVRRCPSVERLIAEGVRVSGPEDLLPAIRADVSPIDDLRSTARYRERTAARLLYHDLRGVVPSFV